MPNSMISPPDVLTIPRVLAHAVARYPERIAIEEDGLKTSYRALQQQSRDVSRALIAHGIVAGDRIAVWAPNCARWIVAALGIHGVGAVLVPLNTRMKGPEISYILARSGARMLFSVGNFLDTDYPALLKSYLSTELERIVVMEPVRQERVDDTPVSCWDDFLAAGTDAGIGDAEVQARSDAVTPAMLSDIMFTSGTTGAPKGVMTVHEQNIRTVIDWCDAMRMCSEDRYLLVNPFFHAFGYKAGWLASILAGATMLPVRLFNGGDMLRRVARDRISVLTGTPPVYLGMMSDPDFANSDLSSLRATITGATTISPTLIERLRKELGFAVVLTGYGLTECCGTATLCDAEDAAETVATTSGRALPNVELKIVDADGQDLPRGQQGEVWIRGYNVMQGYFNDPEETAKAIDSDGWLHTGDIGVLDAGGCLRITDRLKDMFIAGGFNCYPAEIERLMSAHPAVMQVAVIGVEDERMGEVGKAFVVLRPGTLLTAADFIDWCRHHMANYKVPRYVELVPALPLNASGKVLKGELRKQPLASPAGQAC